METEANPARRKRVIQSLVGILISALLLGALVSQMDTDAAIKRVKQADAGWIMASFLMGTLLLIARAARFKLLTTQSDLSTVTAAISVQTFINRIAPFRLGELSLPYFLNRAAGEPPVQAIISLVLVRLLELWVLLVVSALAVIGWFGLAQESNGAIFLVGAGILTVMLFSFRIWVSWGARIAGHLTRLLGISRIQFVQNILERIEEAVSNGERQSFKQWVLLLTSSAVVFVLTVATYDCLLRAVGLELNPLQVIIGVAVAMVAGAIPVTSVGSFGTHETGWTAGFVWVGLNLNDALITGLITQVMTLVFNVILAAPAHLYLLRKNQARAENDTVESLP